MTDAPPPGDDDPPPAKARRRARGAKRKGTGARPTKRRPEAQPPPPSTRPVADEIVDLEARLERVIVGSGEEPRPSTLSEDIETVAREVVERLSSPPIPARTDDSATDVARDLLASDYYFRQWGRMGMRSRSEEVDDFGLDPTFEAQVRPVLDLLCRRYFRIDVQGIENVPNTGRCVIVANHSGTLPLDGLMLRTAFRLHHPAARDVRWLAEDFVYHLPFLGSFMSRIGAVRACQENAERLLLRHDALVGVFPEGVKGIGKLYRERYRLQRFGRGGFIRLCLRTRTPLVPCAIIGAEEANPMLFRLEAAGKALGLPYLPVTPTFPWLGPAGLLPAPTRWRVVFGDLQRFDDHDAAHADDPVLVGRLAERVRTEIQSLLDDGVRARKSLWF